VHLAGQSCDMVAIHALSQRYGFKILEDASHAIGARYQGEPVGSCRYSDISVFSFHPVKIITTAEGGMATTNSAELGDRMARLATHGITRNPKLMTHAPDGDWYYQQTELGLNYRMTELHGALGLSQMARLDSYVARRHEIARRYDAMLGRLPLRAPYQAPYSHSALHLYPIWLDPAKIDRKRVFDALRRDGIGVNVHYIPVHTQPYYQRMGFRAEDFPESLRYYAGAVSIPMYPTMTDDQHDVVVAVLGRALA
jgi:dTDP-4-amino-4,6-dideoxygalactose transaminase